MQAFRIHGGRPLRGTVAINGSKNAALPLMAAALLTDEPVTLHAVPDLADTRNMRKLLRSLGVEIAPPDADGAPHTCAMQATDPSQTTAEYDIVRTMRAGICVLGPLLAKRGHARVSMPGGCAIGTRPVDLHLRGLRALGAEITLDAGDIVATAPRDSQGHQRLIGRHVFLGGPNGSTVLGTANVLSAAALAQGTTVIECAACEPEIEDLGRLLISMGANIEGLGSPKITVHGVEQLGGAEHRVIPDRIEAGTYVIAAAISAGDVTLTNYPTCMLGAFHDRLDEVGVTLDHLDAPAGPAQENRRSVRVNAPRRLNPCHAVTQPHPGFPTDLQAQLMALLCLADGNSMVTEKIFPDRFLHVPELQRMGADIKRLGTNALIHGVRELVGAPVMASDLRASAGLVLAGLAARGQTVINRVYHLDRGYEKMELTLQQLGADIERFDAD
ncbi:MAG: UDP-N-acetylglucosamine 1-carboxyvinyltransferase [Planctomycetota bacterium]